MKGKIQELLSKRNLLVSCLALVLIVGSVLAASVLSEKTIDLVVDGASQSYQTKAKTVQEFLAEANVDYQAEDEIEPGLEEQINRGDVITLNRAVEITLTADWQTQTFKTTPKTVADVLKERGVTLGENDWISPAVTETVAQGTDITINRVNYVQREETITIQPQEIRKNDNTLEKGTRKVVNKGSAGQDKVTYEITYLDGEPIGKTEVARETIKVAEDRVVATGTLSVASRSGRDFSFNKAMTVTSTAYTHTGNRTATGTSPRVGTVAVDPSVIPLGTKLYVEGYGYARAEDTGGAIKGNKIDVFFDSASTCRKWGVKRVKIYVLD